MSGEPISSVIVQTPTTTWPVIFDKVDLPPCTLCGALRWCRADDWDTRGTIRCSECNHHATWQEAVGR